MRKALTLAALCAASLAAISCRTTKSFDKLGAETERERPARNFKEEREAGRDEVQRYLLEEELKEVDVEKTVVYVDRPVYYPAGEKPEAPALKGKKAAQASTEEAVQEPTFFTAGTMVYDFDKDFTYEIYCQPFRVTDIILEPGEQVIEMPFLSEEKVWEVGAGVSREGNVDTQHFFMKPAYSGLITSFIIITDKRVYHMLLKSFKDCYMTQVKWKYPNTMPFNLMAGKLRGANGVGSLSQDSTGVDPMYLSFDYKMSYSIFKKPYWLPKRVYDDGRRTFIVMDETVLHMVTPVLFNKRNHMINYSVNKNIIVVPELIEKLTLRVGYQKVVIKKKSYREEDEARIPANPPKEDKAAPELEPPKKMMLHTNGFIKKEDPKKEEKKKEEPPAPQQPPAVYYDPYAGGAAVPWPAQAVPAQPVPAQPVQQGGAQ